MADKLLGLYGPGEGPRVFVGGRKAKARIRGLKEGEEVSVAHGDVVDAVIANCDLELRSTDYVSFGHCGSSKQLMCLILIED